MKIDLIVIKTTDPHKLAHFYSLLGIIFEYHNHGDGPYHYAGKINELIFEIYPLPKNVTQPDNTLRLGISIKNLDETIKLLNESDVKILAEPSITAFGYHALIEDPDGRKIELKDEEITICRYKIQDVFKITGRGLVFIGVILDGTIYTGDEISFSANNSKRIRQIKGIDIGRKGPSKESNYIGLLIKCMGEEEIEELRQWKPEGQIALIKNKKNT